MNLIDARYDGEPQKFKDRILIFGCLNDIDIWPQSRDEPRIEKFVRAAEEIRDYLRRFEFGRVIWIGPGSEKIWNYGGRQIWDPWANAFMNIIEDSGILIFTGRRALSGRVLRQNGQNEHLDGVTSNKLMLIKIIHSSLKIAAFIGMVKLTPKEADDLSQEVGEGSAEKAGEYDYASAIEDGQMKDNQIKWKIPV